jgi:spermidine/putrescine-binding protein
LLGTENNPIAFGLSTDISRAVAHNDHIGFFVPKEGGFYIIDSIAIPRKSEHEDLAYAFINFLYRAEVMNHHMDLYHMYSPLIDTQEPIGYFPSAQVFSRMQLLTDVISEDAYNSIWIDVLSH